MNTFDYKRVFKSEAALHAIAEPKAKFLAGGTNLLDLMKYGAEAPSSLIDINHLDAFATVTPTEAGGVSIGALVRNSDLANHPLILRDYPLISEAILSGASPQLRNMATTGGNLLQRTRCYYFMDATFPACNKRVPGSGCAAVHGFNRIHAILGQTDKGSESPETCIATNPSDMNVALAALGAQIKVQSPHRTRTISVTDFHLLPGIDPQHETTLARDELIVAVTLPPPRFAANSHYLKVRDRNSYAFALISVAVGLEVLDGRIRSAGLALGGVAHKPWRSLAAERSLVGATLSHDRFGEAADLALSGAKTYEHNAFKVGLAKQGIVRALTVAYTGSGIGAQA